MAFNYYSSSFVFLNNKLLTIEKCLIYIKIRENRNLTKTSEVTMTSDVSLDYLITPSSFPTFS